MRFLFLLLLFVSTLAYSQTPLPAASATSGGDQEAVLPSARLKGTTADQIESSTRILIRNASSQDAALLLFQDKKANEVGRLHLNRGNLYFSGDVDESARLFLEAVDRDYLASLSRGNACRFDDVLGALLLAQQHFVPVQDEQPNVLVDPYSGSLTPDHRSWLMVPAIHKIDLDRASPQELRQLAEAREKEQARLTEENKRAAEQVAQRNQAAQQIRAVLKLCGVQFKVEESGNFGEVPCPSPLPNGKCFRLTTDASAKQRLNKLR